MFNVALFVWFLLNRFWVNNFLDSCLDPSQICYLSSHACEWTQAVNLSEPVEAGFRQSACTVPVRAIPTLSEAGHLFSKWRLVFSLVWIISHGFPYSIIRIELPFKTPDVFCSFWQNNGPDEVKSITAVKLNFFNIFLTFSVGALTERLWALMLKVYSAFLFIQS